MSCCLRADTERSAARLRSSRSRVSAIIRTVWLTRLRCLISFCHASIGINFEDPVLKQKKKHDSVGKSRHAAVEQESGRRYRAPALEKGLDILELLESEAKPIPASAIEIGRAHV